MLAPLICVPLGRPVPLLNPMPVVVLEVDAAALAFPRHSRREGAVNGGGYQWADVALSVAAVNALTLPEGTAWVLLDLTDSPPESKAAHAYLASVIDALKRRCPGVKVGIRDCPHCHDLCDFVAPWMGVTAAVGMGTGWARPDEAQAELASRVVAAGGCGLPIVALVDVSYQHPGDMLAEPIGEWELATVADFATRAGASIALCSSPASIDGEATTMAQVARRLRGILDPAQRRGVPPEPSGATVMASGADGASTPPEAAPSPT